MGFYENSNMHLVPDWLYFQKNNRITNQFWVCISWTVDKSYYLPTFFVGGKDNMIFTSADVRSDVL